ncbi:MAG: hypothetical protein J07HB67_00546, partial [halophilic archaeon J07HB67]
SDGIDGDGESAGAGDDDPAESTGGETVETDGESADGTVGDATETRETDDTTQLTMEDLT